MLKVLQTCLVFLRARWRWVYGRCPRCNRNLYARFPNHMADDPNCPVCKDETETDLRVWHTYRTLGAAERPNVVQAVVVEAKHPQAGQAPAAGSENGNWPGSQTLDLGRDQCEHRWRDDGGQG